MERKIKQFIDIVEKGRGRELNMVPKIYKKEMERK
jgi:hypothetical protein